MFSFSVKHPENLVSIGILTASNLVSRAELPELETRLKACLEERIGKELKPEEELIRSQSRDMLRYKSYKPTGRSKPASEYLLRTADRKSVV